MDLSEVNRCLREYWGRKSLRLSSQSSPVTSCCRLRCMSKPCLNETDVLRQHVSKTHRRPRTSSLNISTSLGSWRASRRRTIMTNQRRQSWLCGQALSRSMTMMIQLIVLQAQQLYGSCYAGKSYSQSPSSFPNRIKLQLRILHLGRLSPGQCLAWKGGNSGMKPWQQSPTEKGLVRNAECWLERQQI